MPVPPLKITARAPPSRAASSAARISAGSSFTTALPTIEWPAASSAARIARPLSSVAGPRESEQVITNARDLRRRVRLVLLGHPVGVAVRGALVVVLVVVVVMPVAVRVTVAVVVVPS